MNVPDSFFASLGVCIGNIVQYCPTVTRHTLISSVEEIIANNNQGVVILDDKKPVGLLMKNKLYYQLGTQYGMSLYYRRPVEKVMDPNPLIVSADLPLEAVSQAAMNRSEENLYDLIIVVKDNKYIGTVSVIHLLKHVTQIQIKCAHNSNPLTGLPGNLIIEEYLKRIVETQDLFAVLYIDIDNFKAFNDKYGFERGDKALLFTAGILNSCLSQYGSPASRDLLGHIGGDDFIIVTKSENYEKLCQAIVEQFDQGIRDLYDEKDIEKGYIKVTNRQGKKELFPIMTVSIAVVTNQYRTFTNYLEIGEIAAEVKKKAKETPQSIWLVDRRKHK